MLGKKLALSMVKHFRLISNDEASEALRYAHPYHPLCLAAVTTLSVCTRSMAASRYLASVDQCYQ